jgi:hypothetical protein
VASAPIGVRRRAWVAGGGGLHPEVACLEALARGDFEMVALTQEDAARMGGLVDRYEDLPLGTTDASVIAIAERMGIKEVATHDAGTSSSCARAKLTRSRRGRWGQNSRRQMGPEILTKRRYGAAPPLNGHPAPSIAWPRSARAR